MTNILDKFFLKIIYKGADGKIKPLIIDPCLIESMTPVESIDDNTIETVIIMTSGKEWRIPLSPENISTSIQKTKETFETYIVESELHRMSLKKDLLEKLQSEYKEKYEKKG